MGYETSVRIYPARLAWPDGITNAGSVNSDIEHLRLTSKAKGIEQLKYFTQLKSLWCFDINERALDQICDCASLENLYIAGLKAGDLSCISRLMFLRFLRLERCSKVDSLDELGRLHMLEGLSIEGFKNVHNIEPLSHLTNLQELDVSGSMWTRMTIESLTPIASLHDLNYLGLTNLKVRDESLRPLSGLNKLQTLHIANFYPMEEFAWLRGTLKKLDCNFFEPFLDAKLPCPKCNRNTLGLLTGKNKPKLCKVCDAVQLAKHIAEFRQLEDNAAQGKLRLIH